MIISASYKTDIPALYGRWFLGRLEAGYCKVSQPFTRAVRSVSLRPDDVDGFVFWTKNLSPFLTGLREVRARGFPFIVQYTINNYPRELERAVPSAQRTLESFRMAASEFAPRSLVWRYDTILFTSLTGPEFHLANFEALASELEAATDEVVVSFAQIYRKTERNLRRAAAEHGFIWSDPPDALKREFIGRLAGVAKAHGMRISVCSQPQLVVPEAKEASCIDAVRLSDVAGRPVSAKLKGNRPGCRCYQATDIGEYDTCSLGCVYCYAVRSRSAAVARLRAHDPEGESLFPLPDCVPDDSPEKPADDSGQLSLF